MKILWIVNTVFPAPSKALGLSEPVAGGWMYGLAVQVSKIAGIELSVATTFTENELKKMTLDGICYYLLPCKNDVKLGQYWEEVCRQSQPDLVHIHGTEYAHGLACMRRFPELNYVVSIQGLLNVCARYYYAGISFLEIFKNITFRDIVRWDTILQQKRKFVIRGKLEHEYIARTQHVIGRTSWDLTHTKIVNNQVNYHFCNETLRNGFYTAKKWSIENCERHTIFLSQAGYPLKGLHQVIKALVILKKDFPDLLIKVGGSKIVKQGSIKNRLKQSGYGKYIKNLIKKNKLQNNVEFLGILTEELMISEYKKANVFVCPSSIENSPNSLGEAQLLGVPSIAAYVGGVSNMVDDGVTGLLYRFEEVEMLAENLRLVFNDNNLALQLSENGIIAASLRHNKKLNLKSLVKIYNVIVK